MRRLLPSPADEVDLDEAYAYPAELGDRPWVRANMVASLDGSVQLDGRSGGLSGPADRRVFGVLRGLADVVLVGAETVRREGYRPAKPKAEYADRRAALGQPAAPAMAVVSQRLALDPDDPIFAPGAVRTLVVTSSTSDLRRRQLLGEVADVLVVGTDRVDLAAAVRLLADRGLPRVLCEGGPGVLAQIAAAGVLDELCLTISPLLVAGDGHRVLRGPWLDPPLSMRVGHLLEEDGALLGRYLVTR